MAAHSVRSARWGAGLLVGGLLACLVTPAGAFDGKRKGFLIGFGLGPDQFRVSRTFSSRSILIGVDTSGAVMDSIAVLRARERTTWGTAVTIHFQVGYGFSERLQVYFSKLTDLDFNYYSYSGIRTQSVLSSLAVDYRLGPAHEHWFLTGGIGASSHLFDDVGYGPGAFAGVGRDLGRLSEVRLLTSYGRPHGISAPPGAGDDASSFDISLLFGLLWR